MVKDRQRLGLVALGLALVAALAYQWTSGPVPVVPTSPGRGTAPRASTVGAVPVIGLDRLAPRGEGRVGKRNLFDFGPAPVPVASRAPEPAFVAQATPPPITPPPTPAPPPPLNVKYIGSVENKRGLKVAVFVTNPRGELLTGQEGDVVANRMKVVRIGYESVDVQDVGSDHTRRIPLRGN